MGRRECGWRGGKSGRMRCCGGDAGKEVEGQEAMEMEMEKEKMKEEGKVV